MRWPREKYNGKRIVGVEFKFVIDVCDWHWLPTFRCWKFSGGIHWLCFRTFTNWNYE